MLKLTSGKTIILCALTLLVTSCGDAARYYDLTRTKPEQSDLVGVWMPDKTTREYMQGKGGYDTSLETRLIFEGNGKLKVVNMPDWWDNGFGTSHGTTQSEQGTWRLYQSSGSKTWEITMALPSGTKFMNLLSQKPPYRMFLYIGDPDSGEVLTFTKTGD